MEAELAASKPNGSQRPMVTVVRRFGDPFEAELAEGDLPASVPEDVAVLNRLFYDSSVDLGGLVRIGPRTYVCTKAGWRITAGG